MDTILALESCVHASLGPQDSFNNRDYLPTYLSQKVPL